MDNYQTIAAKLANLTPFSGNTMSAQFAGQAYLVYSYSTLIAEQWWVPQVGEWYKYVVAGKFSTTTSRHQNLVRKAWDL